MESIHFNHLVPTKPRPNKYNDSDSEPKIDLIKYYLENNSTKLTQVQLMKYFFPDSSKASKSGGGGQDKIDINEYFRNIKNYLSGKHPSLDNAPIPSFDEQLNMMVVTAPSKKNILRKKLLDSKSKREGPIDELIGSFETLGLGEVDRWEDVKTNYDRVNIDETKEEEEEININTNLKKKSFFNTGNIKKSVYIFMVYIQRFIYGIYYILSFIRSIPVFGNILVGILLTSLYQKCFIFQIVCDLLIKSTLTIADITGLTNVFYDVCYKILAVFGSVASSYLPGIMNNLMESYFTTSIAQVISEQVSTQVSTQVSNEVATLVSNQIAIQSFQITQEITSQRDSIQLLISLVEENGQTSLTQIINNAIANSATGAITNSATSVIVGLVNEAIRNIPFTIENIANGANGGKSRRQTIRKIRRNKKAKTKKRKANKKTKKKKANKKTKVNRKKSKKRRTKK